MLQQKELAKVFLFNNPRDDVAVTLNSFKEFCLVMSIESVLVLSIFFYFLGFIMKETEILTIVTSILKEELSKQNLSAIVKSNVQPKALDTDPTVYLAITSVKYKGFPKRSDQIKAAEIEHVEGQVYESIIKITGQVIRDISLPVETLSLTSLELTNKVANILHSDRVMAVLKEQGVGVMKIEEITQSFYTDNEANRDQTFASFNFTICYEEVSKTTSPITQTFEFKKYRV